MNSKSWFVVGLLVVPVVGALVADSLVSSGCDNPSSKVYGSDWCASKRPRRNRSY